MRGFRHTTLYGEAAFVSTFFVDGRKTGAEIGQLEDFRRKLTEENESLKQQLMELADHQPPNGNEEQNKDLMKEIVDLLEDREKWFKNPWLS